MSCGRRCAVSHARMRVRFTSSAPCFSAVVRLLFGQCSDKWAIVGAVPHIALRPRWQWPDYSVGRHALRRASWTALLHSLCPFSLVPIMRTHIPTEVHPPPPQKKKTHTPAPLLTSSATRACTRSTAAAAPVAAAGVRIVCESPLCGLGHQPCPGFPSELRPGWSEPVVPHCTETPFLSTLPLSRTHALHQPFSVLFPCPG